MLTRRIVLILLSINSLILHSCTGMKSDEPPKLVVLIAIDQLRAGHLERYDEVFTGGFRRLRDEGFRYDRAMVDHAPTLSYPGHTTLATGAHPCTHGISTNAWLETLPNGEARAESGRFLLEVKLERSVLIGVPKPDTPG
jgi:predicted AlkP superfamily pyrophosphatase or phosphodiesterase